MNRRKSLRTVLYVIPVATLLYLTPGMLLAQEEANPAVREAEAMGEGAAEDTASQAPAGPASDTSPVQIKPGPAAEIAKREAELALEAGQAASEAGEAGQDSDGTAKGDGNTETAPYTEEDLYVLAHVLAGECQNCPDMEQLYVGSVVLNRRAHPSFPKTIKGVVFQKGQYACTWDGNYNREPTERNWENARKLLEEGSILPGHVIFQSGFRQGKGVYLKTEYHYYCY